MSSRISADDVCLDLFLAWLANQHGRHFQIESLSRPQNAVGLSSICTDGDSKLAVEVRHLLNFEENHAWHQGREALEDDIAADLDGGYAVWLPPGAELPGIGDERSAFIRRLRETCSKLEPGERGQLLLPTKIRVYKSSEVGGLMTVAGPLEKYWARMSERVRGAYELDSREIHRLSESDEDVQQIVTQVVDIANAITELRQQVELDAYDVWTVQRLNQDDGVSVIGLPPEMLKDQGIAIRRNMRRNLIDAKAGISRSQCDFRALVSLGFYSHMQDEGATTAMRGYDPATYGDLEFVCLVTDGMVKAQLELPPSSWVTKESLPEQG